MLICICDCKGKNKSKPIKIIQIKKYWNLGFDTFLIIIYDRDKEFK